MIKKKRVVVFGIFDGIHQGHRDFFRQALRQGHSAELSRSPQGKPKEDVELVVIVGRDDICRTLKNKTPKHSEKERCLLVSQEPLVDKALLGDPTLSSYQVLENLKPDVICFGYDQDALEKDVQAWLSNNKHTVETHHLRYFSP